jgi:2,4-diaminopentanoate dehydrogenase
VDEYEQVHQRDAPSLYRVFMHLIVASLGYEVLGVEERREPVTSDTPIVSRSLDCEVVPGRCIGTRFVIDLATVEGMSAHAELEARLGPPGETEHMSWTVDGDPSSSLRLERQDSVHATAACVINRVPDVIAAPPGMVTVDQLGPMQFANPEGS